MWYKRRERQYRIALFFSAASLAGAFGGILAFGIAKMKGVGGYNGWSVFSHDIIFSQNEGMLHNTATDQTHLGGGFSSLKAF